MAADWTSMAPSGDNNTHSTTTAGSHDTADDAHRSRSRDDQLAAGGYDEYAGDELDSSVYRVTSSAKPEVHPLVVDIYAVSSGEHSAVQRRRHDRYSWSRGHGPMTSSSDDDYDDYGDYDDDDYADLVDDTGHVTSYVGRPGSRGHDESSLGQSRWTDVDKASRGNRAVAVATAAAAVATMAVTVVAVR